MLLCMTTRVTESVGIPGGSGVNRLDRASDLEFRGGR